MKLYNYFFFMGRNMNKKYVKFAILLLVMNAFWGLNVSAATFADLNTPPPTLSEDDGEDDGEDGEDGEDDDGSHYSGENCMQGGCHATDHAMSVAGTVYADAAGSTLLAGATVHVTDAKGSTATLTSDSKGNFWARTKYYNLTAPFSIKITYASGTAIMVSKAAGSCNATGCHSASGGNGRVYVLASGSTGGPLPGETHNEGQDCLTSGCHVKFPKVAGGTIYTDTAGSAPQAGATIKLEDTAGKIATLVSDSKGNFYTNDTTLTPPFKVTATYSTGTATMSALATGNCNSGGCHVSGKQGRIYITSTTLPGGPAPGETHNAGKDCLTSGCHGATTTKIAGGTIYIDKNGAFPKQGVTVTLEGINGKTVSMTSDELGNFYTNDSTLLPPFKVTATYNGTQAKMSALATGDCNSGGCHVVGKQGTIFINQIIADNITTDVKANNSDAAITVKTGEAVTIKLTLLAVGGLGKQADWWVVAKTPWAAPNDWYYFDAATATWKNGIGVCHKGPLSIVAGYPVLSTTGLPAGTYKFYFGVDMLMNGTLEFNLDELSYDSVDVTVTN